MRRQFYHAIALCALLAPACSRPARDTPAPATGSSAATAAVSSTASPSTAASSTADGAAGSTADGLRLGTEIIERVRTAAGGAKLTALRSFEATGSSTMSIVAGTRALSVRALYPGFYRQEEIPSTKGRFAVALGIAEGMGWMIGAQINGDAASKDAAAVQATYNRAASQAMAGFLAGVNAPWLVDSGQFVPIGSGKVDGGDDRNLDIVRLEGPFGRAGRLLIDPVTNLPRRFIEPPQPGTGGEASRNELNFAYTDFRLVDGVMLPHMITRRVGRIETRWSIAAYTLNPKLRPVEFTRRMAARVK